MRPGRAAQAQLRRQYSARGPATWGVVAVVCGVVVQFTEAFAVVQQGGEVAIEAQEAVAGGFGGFTQEDDVGAVYEAAQQVDVVLGFALCGDG